MVEVVSAACFMARERRENVRREEKAHDKGMSLSRLAHTWHWRGPVGLAYCYPCCPRERDM
jgi:hypothetical protein